MGFKKNKITDKRHKKCDFQVVGSPTLYSLIPLFEQYQQVLCCVKYNKMFESIIVDLAHFYFTLAVRLTR